MQVILKDLTILAPILYPYGHAVGVPSPFTEGDPPPVGAHRMCPSFGYTVLFVEGRKWARHRRAPTKNKTARCRAVLPNNNHMQKA
jgi:hypothetical protein